MIEQGTALYETVAIFNIHAPSTILAWKLEHETEGLYALKSKKKGRPSMKKESKSPVPTDGSVEALQESRTFRNGEYLLKKVDSFSSNAGKITNKIKEQVTFELKEQYEVVDLVKVADILHSTYYY
jgi:transposase